mgnify:CR=1 FL=1
MRARTTCGLVLTLAIVIWASCVHAQRNLALQRQTTEKRVALVIGNSKYQWETQLPNVRRDVAAVARRLQAYGLKTELLEDSGRDAEYIFSTQVVVSARQAHALDEFVRSHPGSRALALDVTDAAAVRARIGKARLHEAANQFEQALSAACHAVRSP